MEEQHQKDVELIKRSNRLLGDGPQNNNLLSESSVAQNTVILPQNDTLNDLDASSQADGY